YWLARKPEELNPSRLPQYHSAGALEYDDRPAAPDIDVRRLRIETEQRLFRRHRDGPRGVQVSVERCDRIEPHGPGGLETDHDPEEVPVVAAPQRQRVIVDRERPAGQIGGTRERRRIETQRD